MIDKGYQRPQEVGLGLIEPEKYPLCGRTFRLRKLLERLDKIGVGVNDCP
jgi:hypothetical protein